jgi:hypothetical protein
MPAMPWPSGPQGPDPNTETREPGARPGSQACARTKISVAKTATHNEGQLSALVTDSGLMALVSTGEPTDLGLPEASPVEM